MRKKKEWRKGLANISNFFTCKVLVLPACSHKIQMVRTVLVTKYYITNPKMSLMPMSL